MVSTWATTSPSGFMRGWLWPFWCTKPRGLGFPYSQKTRHELLFFVVVRCHVSHIAETVAFLLCSGLSHTFSVAASDPRAPALENWRLCPVQGGSFYLCMCSTLNSGTYMPGATSGFSRKFGRRDTASDLGDTRDVSCSLLPHIASSQAKVVEQQVSTSTRVRPNLI